MNVWRGGGAPQPKWLASREFRVVVSRARVWGQLRCLWTARELFRARFAFCALAPLPLHFANPCRHCFQLPPQPAPHRFLCRQRPPRHCQVREPRRVPLQVVMHENQLVAERLDRCAGRRVACLHVEALQRVAELQHERR